MPTFTKHPLVSAVMASMVGATLLLLGLWGPVARILFQGQAAETQRVLDVFQSRLAESVAKGDDLARIDVLRQLHKLPGVVVAEVGNDALPVSWKCVPLIWEGKAVGRLHVELSRASWQRLRYLCIERTWTLIVLAGLVGGAVGYQIQNRRKRHLLRLIRLAQHRHRRLRLAKAQIREQISRHYQSLLDHALEQSRDGWILLNDRQKIIGVNARAREVLGLPLHVIGRHWCDTQESLEWANALRDSTTQPGNIIPVPGMGPNHRVSLRTESEEGRTAFTWIKLQLTSAPGDI